MTATYSPDEVERLIVEAMYDDETIQRAIRILHEACSRDIRERRPGDLQLVAHVLRDAIATRRAMADQLEAARTELDEAKTALLRQAARLAALESELAALQSSVVAAISSAGPEVGEDERTV